MSLLWKGLGLIFAGVLTIVWWIVKAFASLIIAITVSGYYNLTGIVWWCSTIVIFALLCKVLFYGNNASYYQGLVDDYRKEVNETRNILDDEYY